MVGFDWVRRGLDGLARSLDVLDLHDVEQHGALSIFDEVGLFVSAALVGQSGQGLGPPRTVDCGQPLTQLVAVFAVHAPDGDFKGHRIRASCGAHD
jgi:hypothetical protein